MIWDLPSLLCSRRLLCVSIFNSDIYTESEISQQQRGGRVATLTCFKRFCKINFKVIFILLYNAMVVQYEPYLFCNISEWVETFCEKCSKMYKVTGKQCQTAVAAMKKKAKSHLWSMFEINCDSHDCAEDQGLKFYNVRVTELVSTLAIIWHIKHLKCQALLRWRCSMLLFQLQTTTRVNQVKRIHSVCCFTPKSPALVSQVCTRLDTQAPVHVSQHLNIIWECVLC